MVRKGALAVAVADGRRGRGATITARVFDRDRTDFPASNP